MLDRFDIRVQKSSSLHCYGEDVDIRFKPISVCQSTKFNNETLPQRHELGS